MITAMTIDLTLIGRLKVERTWQEIFADDAHDVWPQPVVGHHLTLQSAFLNGEMVSARGGLREHLLQLGREQNPRFAAFLDATRPVSDYDELDKMIMTQNEKAQAAKPQHPALPDTILLGRNAGVLTGASSWVVFTSEEKATEWLAEAQSGSNPLSMMVRHLYRLDLMGGDHYSAEPLELHAPKPVLRRAQP